MTPETKKIEKMYQVTLIIKLVLMIRDVWVQAGSELKLLKSFFD